MINSVDEITSSVISLFEEQAVHAANNVALIYGQVQITFEQLNNRANQLAHHLVQNGVQADTLVPVCLHPGIDMIIGIYAILKAGGAYVPVDPAYPAERINFILNDTGASIILATNSTKHIFEDSLGLTIIAVDDNAEYGHYPQSNLTVNINPGQLAYIIYTSGSTGKPKGVMIEHGNLGNYLFNKQTAYINKHSNDTGGFMHMSFTFDASVTTLFMPLLSGKALVISDKKSFEVFDDANFGKYAPYDFIKITPAHLQLLKKCIVENGIAVTKKLVIGGEALTYAHVEFLVNEGLDIEVTNEYGPTEATVGCSVYSFNTSKVDEGFKARPISIGKPIAEVEMYILNKRNEPLPAGIPGEICISGKGVARGYLNRTDITSDNFITTTVGSNKQVRLYKTGDYGMWSPDGNMEYLGRKDDQVKVRGYRVELGEVENVILQNEFVEQAVVLAKNDSSGFSQLVGYIVSKKGYCKKLLFDYLNDMVPAYMVPASIIELKEMPLTSHGKIDKKALLQMEDRPVVQAENDVVATQLEEDLRTIWMDLLELDEVGLNEDFFNIGGHSILAIRLVSAIRKQLQVEVSINDVFDFPTIIKLSEHIAGGNNAEAVQSSITAIHPRPDFIPLSFSQERLWFIDKLEGSIQYHVPMVLRLTGRLDISALCYALAEIVNRHEVLRTVFREEEGKTYQSIKEKGQWNVNIVDGAGFKDESALKQFINETISRPFDLSADYMIRAHLITRGEDDNKLVITLHHIASDGWSISILVDEVAELYQSYSNGRPARLEPLPVQYADFAIWQKQLLQGAFLEDKLLYWKQQLKDTELLQLPIDFNRPPIQSIRGNLVSFMIDRPVTEQLQKLGKKQDATLFMTLLSAFKVLLYRYTNQQDICVGTPIAGRQHQEIENLIGLFVNTLAIRTFVDGQLPFTGLLEQVKLITMQAYEHQEVPFEKVVDEVVKERDLSRSPLVPVQFVFRNLPKVQSKNFGGLTLSGEPYEHTTSPFDMTFFATEGNTGISIGVEYCTDLFKKSTIDRMIGHFTQLLSSITQYPDTSIDDLVMISADEKQQLLQEFNQTTKYFPNAQQVTSLFEQQVMRVPGQTALVYNEYILTYQQLNQRVNQLARQLIITGVQPGSVVPMFMEQGIEMIVGILAILKCGAAYVPIDVHFPLERIVYIYDETQATIALSTKAFFNKLPALENVKAVLVDEDENLRQHSAENVDVDIKGNQLAYIIYTSGSTGKPKGVMIDHDALRNYLLSCREKYMNGQGNSSGTFVHLSYTFDASITAIFLPLISGRSMVISSKTKYEVFEDKNLLKYAPYDFIKLTPAHLGLLKPTLEYPQPEWITGKLVIGGEALLARHIQDLVDNKIDVEIFNEYGPTEATVGCSIFHFNALKDIHASGNGISIGKPIHNVNIYILTQGNKLAPVGVAGEICIAGAGLARGYLNQTDLTKEKFVENPFNLNGETGLYRTGDLGKWLEDGNIEYLGRMDDQVKVKGFRIELGAIESVLLQSGVVKNAAVLAKVDALGNTRLVSYYVPEYNVVKAKEKELYVSRVNLWQELYETEYDQEQTEVEETEFNLVGWDDSFTGNQIAAEQMGDWLNDIVSVILLNEPGNVLEIGTGSGLIFYKLAGKVKKYIGTDFSSVTINKIKNHIAKGARNYGNVEFHVCPAHQVCLDENRKVDTIIINSVAQYFPGEDYMTLVIERCIEMLNDNGRIIIGDIRDNRLLEWFKYRVQLQKLQDSVTLKHLDWSVQAEVLKENELCFSPAYFIKFKEMFAQISHVELVWKNSGFINELTSFRYTAIIYKNDTRPTLDVDWKAWSEDEASRLLSRFNENQTGTFGIAHVPNPRLNREAVIRDNVQRGSLKTVGELNVQIENSPGNNIWFDSIISAAHDYGYSYKLLVNEDPFLVNIVFSKNLATGILPLVYDEDKINIGQPSTNTPLFMEIGVALNTDIKDSLQQKLPEYFIPAELHAVAKLPLTTNGKIDKKFLAKQEDRQMTSGNYYAAPQTEAEVILATIWQDLLGLERVGIHDNFFELGGDSITTIQVVSRLRRVGYHLQPRDLFINQTIARLATIIDNNKDAVTHGEQGKLDGESGLLPIQQWYLQTNPADVSYFNQAVLLSVDKNVTTEMLQDVYNHLLQQHDALRFKYKHNNGQWTQQYDNHIGNVIKEVLVEQEPAISLADQVKEKAGQYQASLDIFTGDITRFVHFITPDTHDKNRLFMVVHHLAVDGVSWRIILEDLENMLMAISNNQPVIAGAKSSSYRQWYQALQQYGQQPLVLAQLSFWQKAVKAFTPLRPLHDVPVPATDNNTIYRSAKLSVNTTQRLIQDVPKVYHTEINDLLLAALAIVLTRFTNDTKVVIGLEGHGREHISETIDTSRTVGWFTSLYPVALQVPDQKGYDAIIKSVKEHLRRVPQKGLGYGVLKYINKDEALQGNEPWDIMFNYLGQLDNVIAKSKWFDFATEPVGSSRSALQSVQEKLALNSSIQRGQLVVNWACNGNYFTPENIELLSQQYLQTIEQLVDHCLDHFKKGGQVFTPSDFGLGAEISYSELDRFLAEPFKHGTRKDHTESIYRLSGLQQGLLFHGLYEEGAIAYIDQFSCDLVKVNIPSLSATWKMILDRHTSLRSSFHYDAFSIPVQCVYHSVDLPLDIMDLRNLTGEEQRKQVDQFARQDRIKGFDFKVAPLIRMSLLQLADNRYRMVWTYSHILFDGWSMPVLMEEFLTTYQQLSQNHEVPLLKVDKFEDYIRFIEQQDEAKEQAYWKNLVKQVTENTSLPFVNKRSGRSDVAEVYEKITLTFNEKITASIQQYAHQNLLTVNTVMQGVWAYLLHHYTNSQAITYGVIVSGRPEELPDIEKRVGMFINTLPLISTMHKGEKISGWLQQLQHTQVASRQYQYTPLTQVQQWAGIMGDWFDTLLVFENYPINKLIKSERWNLDIENVQVDYQTNYPFNIIIASAEQINVGFSFNTQLISTHDAHKIRDHFEHVLLQIISGKQNTEDIQVITPAEEYRLLHQYNNTQVSYPHEKNLVSVFEQNVNIHEKLSALIFDGAEISYAELNTRANQLAHYMQHAGVQPGMLVPVCIQRGVNMVVAILAILKCAAAYVPIDVAYPIERKTYILNDTGCTLLITDKATLPFITVKSEIEVLNLDELKGKIEKHSVENLQVSVVPTQLAYVIYTSGSTGMPKGVMIEHAGVVNLALSQAKSLKLRPGLRSLQFASFGFDASCYEIFNTLLSGGTLVIPQKEDLLSAPAFGRMLELNQVELAVLPPSFQQEIKENTGPLKTIVSAGEPLNATTARYFQSKDIRLINAYGPTENTVCTTMTDDPLNDEGRITIGRPVANVQVFIVDRLGNLCAEGINGELYIEGEQLARGYFNREDLTGEKFLERSFMGNSRLYKSGDTCRWLPGGNIEYVGRIDDQVKIRGFRIEPGEIEHTLVNSPLVKEAVVLAIGDGQHNKKLVAYVVTGNGFSKEAITAYLSQILPAYMVPAVFVNVEKMPVTSSGKIDKKALSILGLEESEVKNYVPPETALEIKLTRIWEELLGIDKIGIEDNFFELGGNSLLAMRMTAHIERALGLTIPIQVLFQARCISDLSKYFEIQSNNIDTEKNTETFELLDV